MNTKRKKQKIKLIIVDIYGVISLGSFWNVTRLLAKKYNQDPKKIYDVLYMKYFNAAALGKLTEKEFFTKALKELNMDIDWKYIRDKHLAYQVPNKPVIEMCTELQKQGYTLLLLSKNIPSHFRKTVQTCGLRKKFEHITNVFDLKLPKASKKTMLWGLKKFKVKPEEVVFCDDQDFNLVQAKKMGITAILYKDVPQFKRELRKALA